MGKSFEFYRCWPSFLFYIFFLEISILALVSSHASASNTNEPFAIRISCGSREDVITPPTNTLWYRDFGYTGGRLANATLPSQIAPPLKTLRYFPLSDGPENCYNINNIPNGHYVVRIFFALFASPDVQNEPIFDVSIEGTQICSLKRGWSKIDDQTFVEGLAFVTDTSISACFHSTGHGDPAILSIEVLQVDPNEYNVGAPWGSGIILRTIKRITCGVGRSSFDEDYGGNHWGGDRFWQGIETFDKGSDQSLLTENNITGTSVSPNFYPQLLYQSAIVGTVAQPEITFQMDVDPTKNYSVWLHFCEIDPGVKAVGQRVFDILINGNVLFTSVDIFGMTGGQFAALVLNKTILVSGRTLTLTLRPLNGSHSLINAIEIFEIIAAEFKTLASEVGALQVLKNSLGLPLRFGWNGDPCVPQQHPWSGIDCQFDTGTSMWVIDGLGLDTQGLRGVLPSDISNLRHLQTLNLSWNSIHGSIPSAVGLINDLEIIDLSHNDLNGSIPESLGQLTKLKILNLNENVLSGRVPSNLGGRPLHRASFNFTGNSGLCGIPGLPSCGPHLSASSEIGIALGAFIGVFLATLCTICWWKRRQNILRAQRIAASREATYAKSRTNSSRDIQMARGQRGHDHPRAAVGRPATADGGTRLIA